MKLLNSLICRNHSHLHILLVCLMSIWFSSTYLSILTHRVLLQTLKNRKVHILHYGDTVVFGYSFSSILFHYLFAFSSLIYYVSCCRLLNILSRECHFWYMKRIDMNKMYGTFQYSLSSLFFFLFLSRSFYFSADNRKMYKADGKVIARCNFGMDREVEWRNNK